MEWEKAEEQILVKEGYDAMLYLLEEYWKLSGSDDLTDILGGGSYFADGRPADPVFWEYWLEAIEKVKKEGPPPPQVLER
jgi:hypothetical protein